MPIGLGHRSSGIRTAGAAAVATRTPAFALPETRAVFHHLAVSDIEASSEVLVAGREGPLSGPGVQRTIHALLVLVSRPFYPRVRYRPILV